MTTFRIVCTDQEPFNQPTTHAHIVGVGTGDNPDKATQRWTLPEVLKAMDAGDAFYTKGIQSGKMALVEKFVCPYCTRTHIRSAPDAVKDNNLDSLRRCRWS